MPSIRSSAPSKRSSNMFEKIRAWPLVYLCWSKAPFSLRRDVDREVITLSKCTGWRLNIYNIAHRWWVTHREVSPFLNYGNAYLEVRIL